MRTHVDLIMPAHNMLGKFLMAHSPPDEIQLKIFQTVHLKFAINVWA